METIKFKTNINCSGCIAKVTPGLNKVAGVNKWEVDTENPNKILTIETDRVTVGEIKEAIEKAGFKAEGIA